MKTRPTRFRPTCLSLSPFVALLLAAAQAAPGTEMDARLETLTANPAADTQPTVDPSGKWLVHVTEVDGSGDLRVVRLDRPQGVSQGVFAPTPAEESAPAFSPDGEWIAWTSTIEDALGDVWVAKWPGGAARNVSVPGMAEGPPWWFERDGEVYLRHLRETAAGETQVVELDTRRWGRRTLAREEAAAIALPSVRFLSDGATAERLNAAREDRRFMARLADDTNADGLIDIRDDASLWRLANGAWRQATTPLPGLSHPAPSGDAVVFAARPLDQMEIMRMAGRAPFDGEASADALLEMARESWRRSPAAPFDAVAPARNAVLADGDGDVGREALLFLADVLRASGRPEQALASIETAKAARWSGTEAVKLNWRRAVLAAEAALRVDPEGPATTEALANARDRLRELSGETQEEALRARLRNEEARLALQAGDPASVALVLEDAAPDAALETERLVLRARGLERMGLGTEAQRLRLEAMRLGAELLDLAERAAAEYLDAAIAGTETVDEAVFAVRQAAAAPGEDVPSVLAAEARLREARLFRDAGRPESARRSYEAAMEMSATQPRVAAQAAFDLAALLTGEGEFAEAIALYEGVEADLRDRFFPRAPAFYREAREGLIRESLAKGYYEMRVRDYLLALATFSALAEREPQLPEAWRGVIDAQARAGVLSDVEKKRYRDEARRQDDALSWYKSGLAASYAPTEDIPSRSLKDIERAIRLDASVPYYHQTRGFLLEAEGRSTDDRNLTLEALASYERALALLDGVERPRDRAALLLNLGNVSLQLRSNRRAAEFYESRLESGQAFEDPITEFLFQRSKGIASFRASRPRAAAEAFQEADFLLDVLINYDLLTGEAAEERRTELLDRRALALMDAGQHRASADLFADVAERRAPTTLSHVRALRNRGFALLREADGASGPEASAARREARTAIEGALEALTARGLEDDREKERTGGLLNLDITLAAGTEPGSLTDISPEAEERLLRTALSRIQLAQGERAAAVEGLERQIADSPRTDAATQGYYATVRLVTLDTLAAERWRLGQSTQAVDALLQALDEAYLFEDDKEIVNTRGLSTVLLRLTEFALAQPEVAPSPERWRETWLAWDAGTSRRRDEPRALSDEPLEALQDVLRLTSARRIYLTPDLMLARAEDRARVELASALVAERLSFNAGGDGVAAVRSAAWATKARLHADDVLRLAQASPRGGEVKRLAVLANGVLIRTEDRLGTEDDAADAVRGAVAFALRQGHGRLSWWLEAQRAAIAPAGTERMESAGRTLDLIERAAPGFLMDGPERPPWELLALLENAHVGEAAARDDWREAWHRSARWTAARLRFATDQATPVALSGNPEDAVWLEEALRLRRDVRKAMERLRGLSASADSASARTLLNAAADRWRAHLADGRDAFLPSALFLDPRAADFETSMELVTGLILPRRAALVLVTKAGVAAGTEEGVRTIESPEDWETLAADAGIWFVLGGETPAAPGGVETIRLTHFDATYGALAAPTLGGLLDDAEISNADLASGLAKDELATAGSVSVGAAVQAEGSDPFAWRVGGGQATVGDLLMQATEARAWRFPTEIEPWAAAGLASAAARSGAAQVTVGTEDWIGAVFPPEEMRDIAEAELNDAANAAAIAWQEGDVRRTLAPAQKAWRLSLVLDTPVAQRIDAGLFLAQVLREAGRRDAAADAAKSALDIAREQGTEADVEASLRLYAAYATDAGRADSAAEAYQELAAGDDARRAEYLGFAAVAMENAGRFQEALEFLAQSESAASDPVERAETLRRRGRIYLLWINDYARAKQAFEQALEFAREAGTETLALQAQLDLARVDERLARYDDAVRRANDVRLAAVETGDGVLEGEAQLVLSFVEWARGEYFKALTAQQATARRAEEESDEVLALQASNQLGLIRWSFNDLDGARGAFNGALELADGPLRQRDRASVLNNRGLVERTAGRFPRAFADFRAALEVDEAQGNDWGRAYALRNIGITHTLSGQPARAAEPLREAIALSTAIGDRTNRAKGLLALGDALRATSDSEAPALYAEAIEEARAIPLPEVEWRALHGEARLALARSDSSEARERLEAAIEVIEGLRARIQVQDYQDGFLLDKLEVYDDLVQLLLNEGEPRAAFEVSERSRGRNFIDLLGADRVVLGTEADQQALEKAGELRLRAETLQREITLAGDATERQRLGRELDEARVAYREFLLELRASNPQVASMVQTPVVELAELQALLDPDVRLVVYHLLPNEAVAWVLGPSSFDVVRTPASRRDISDQVRAMRADMQSFDVVGPSRDRLSGWLTEPLAPLLGTEVQRIGIAPHRELHQAPFAALRMGGADMIERGALFYTPSASVLRYTIARRGRSTSANVIALGNPDLGDPAFNLPMAQKEAERLRWRFPDAEILTGAGATEERLVADASGASIVHLASHGEFDAAAPLFSSLQLAATEDADGRLTAQEVFGLRLDADLVALSACQTGLGRLSNGDDIVGLNMAFLYAGARQVLSTLWRVDDVSTAVLIKHFYRNLGEEDRAEALRQAQLEVRERYPHPAHWAGMYLVGDWE